MFGTQKRVEQAFGQDPVNFVEQAAKIPEKMMPPSLSRLWANRDFFLKALKIGMKSSKSAPVTTHTINNADLTKLPALTSWPEDGGPFLTLPLVHTQSPTSHEDNLGMYRIQIFNKSQSGMHFQIGKGGGYHLYEAEQIPTALKANIYLGGPPALILAAIAPLPEKVSELVLASMLLDGKLANTKVKETPLRAIAEAEFAIIGHIPANIRKDEGPFGDHYGYYSLKHPYPTFNVEQIYHRKNAIFPATIVGKPRQEDFYLGIYLQKLLSPLFPVVMPTVKQLWSYGESGFHALSAAILQERFSREALTSVFRILGEGQLSLTKFLLVTDSNINLTSFKQVLTHILARVDWSKDLYLFTNLALDSLDYSSGKLNHGSKGVILGLGEAKRDLPSDTHGIDFPNWIRNCRVFSPGCLVLEAPHLESLSQIQQLISKPQYSSWQLIIIADCADSTCKNEAAFIWTVFTRFDPIKDIVPRNTISRTNVTRFEGPIAINAKSKPWYPKEVACDKETKDQVTSRWLEYFPSGTTEMGDSDHGHLS